MKQVIRLSILSAIVFGIGMAALQALFFHRAPLPQLNELVGGGVAFGLFVGFMAHRSSRLSAARGEAAFPGRVTRTLSLPIAPDAALDAARSTLNALDGARRSTFVATGSCARIKTACTRASFGEVVSVVVQPDGLNGCALQITSKPLVFSTLIDHGKNSYNVNQLCNALQTFVR